MYLNFVSQLYLSIALLNSGELYQEIQVSEGEHCVSLCKNTGAINYLGLVLSDASIFSLTHALCSIARPKVLCWVTQKI